MPVDVAIFDDQLIDVVTGWISAYRAGLSVHSALYYAGSILMPEPSESEWRKVHDELNELRRQGPNHLGAPLEHLLERVPSENLKLLVDAFRLAREAGASSNELYYRMLDLHDTLWERRDSATKPAVTNYNAVWKTLAEFSFNDDDRIRAEARGKLLSLGNHLIQYLICAMDFGHAHSKIAVYSLLRMLLTDGAMKNIRRMAAGSYEAACAILDELGIPYEVERQGDNIWRRCWVCHNLIPDDQPTFVTDVVKRAYFCSEAHRNRGLGYLDD